MAEDDPRGTRTLHRIAQPLFLLWREGPDRRRVKRGEAESPDVERISERVAIGADICEPGQVCRPCLRADHLMPK
jgi:hypothetical protein